MSTRFRVLGPIGVWTDGEEITPAGRLQRRLLAALLGAPAGLSNRILCELLWGDGEHDARLHLLVHRTRGLLDRVDRLERTAEGYRIVLEAGEVDLDRLDLLVDTQPAEALAMATTEPFRDCEGQYFDGLREGLSERLAAVRKRALRTALHLGDDDLVLQTAHHAREREPYDEELTEIHMTALSRAGRISEALEIYDGLRRQLASELGVDPGPALRALHLELISGSGGVRTAPNQLPPHSVELLGREAAFGILDTILDGGPQIAVVTGTGGVGKTSLAMAWAARVRERFVDGILYVDLRGFGTGDPADPVTVIVAFLRTLGRPVSPALGINELSGMLRGVTDRRSLLILLDSAHDEAQVRPLLPAADGPAVIVTSREVLPGLGVHMPVLGVQLEPLAEADATELVRAQVPGLDLVASARLAERCARLPLAIMVAARAAASGREDLLDELGGSRALDALEIGDVESDLVTVLSWSLDDLDMESRRLFCLLGLVSSPMTIQAIIALAGGDPVHVRSMVRRLQRANLISRVDSTRYTMHDLLRELAAGLCAKETSSHEVRQARTRLLTHFEYGILDFTGQTYPHYGQLFVPILDKRPTTPPVDLPSDALPPALADVVDARHWLERELPAITEVIAAADASNDEQVVRMVLRMRVYATSLGYLSAAQFSLFHQLRMRAIRMGDRFVEAAALRFLGMVGFIHEGVPAAQRWLTAAADISRADGDRRRIAHATSNLGELARYLEEYDEALPLFAEAMEIYEDVGLWSTAAETNSKVALVYIAKGDYKRAEDLARRSLGFAERGTNVVIHNTSKAILALALVGLDRIEEARAVVRDAQIGTELVEDHNLTGMVMIVDAHIQAAGGDLDAAVAVFEDAVQFLRDRGRVPNLRMAWLGLAGVCRARGDLEEAEHAEAEAHRLLIRLRNGASSS